MKRKILFFAILIVCSGYVYSQDITISFAAQGESTTIDELVATNLTTEEFVTLPGNEVLVLHSVATSIGKLLLSSSVNVAPNPFSTSTQLYYRNKKKQQVTVHLVSVTGQVLALNKTVLAAGDHRFQISAGTPGLYILSLIAGNDFQSIKIVQNETGSNRIEYIGTVPTSKHAEGTVLKASMADYVLNYSPGDIISYNITSGIYTTIVNETPNASKTLTVNLVECKDGDGYNYPVVIIGEQIWMAKSLKATKYADGTAIPLVTDKTAWNYLRDNDTDDAYCWYNNDSVQYASTYGALYTWAAAMNGTGSSDANPSGVQGVCPEGWHLPSDAEWTELSDFLGGVSIAGGKMKESGTTHWSSPNTGATNESSFTALPCGYRGYLDAVFNGMSYTGNWWSSTQKSSTRAYLRYLYYPNADVFPSDFYKSSGFSVRCVKD